jgi:hypothetical protein
VSKKSSLGLNTKVFSKRTLKYIFGTETCDDETLQTTKI